VYTSPILRNGSRLARRHILEGLRTTAQGLRAWKRHERCDRLVYETAKPPKYGYGEDGLALHAILKIHFIDSLPSPLEFKSWPGFNSPEHHRQIDAWADDNENDGRELYVVSCWFLGEHTSERMWREYGGSTEAVAIKSTIGRLVNNVFVPRDEHRSHIGLVS
jgi:hypothetical protein